MRFHARAVRWPPTGTVMGMSQDFAGARIRYWRLRRGISQGVLGGLAGVSQSYVSQVESGLKDIDKRSTLIRFAEALQISVADIVDTTDATTPEFIAAAATVPAFRAASTPPAWGRLWSRGDRSRNCGPLLRASRRRGKQPVTTSSALPCRTFCSICTP